MEQQNGPVMVNQRLEWIDALRGFAIFGIFMVNLPAFNAPFFLYGGEKDYWTSPADHVTQALIDIFFQASFYTLFSFLFGFGIQLMYQRLNQRQLNYKTVLLRRLFVLIGFGLIHAFLIWHGDILLTYGILGLLLLLFLAKKNGTLLYWGFGLLLGPTLLFTWGLFAVRDQIGDFTDNQAISRSFSSYGEGSIADILVQNYRDWMTVNGGEGYLFLFFSLFPLFLFGVYTARKRWLHDIEASAAVLKRIWLITGVIFLSFKAGPYLVGNPVWFSMMQDGIGGPASAFFYAASIVMLYRQKKWQRLLRPLTYIGRMSLTNYIAQSIFSFLLFYSVGFGLYGDVRPLYGVMIVIVVYLLQTAASKWWLQRYRFGPLEWVWRSATYRHKPKIRKMGENG